MNTYTVNYDIRSVPSIGPSIASVVAKDFSQQDGFLVFTDDTGNKVFAVPVALNPVVTMVIVPVTDPPPTSTV